MESLAKQASSLRTRAKVAKVAEFILSLRGKRFKSPPKGKPRMSPRAPKSGPKAGGNVASKTRTQFKKPKGQTKPKTPKQRKKKNRSKNCTAAEIAKRNAEIHVFCNQPRSCSMQGDTCKSAKAKVAAGNGCVDLRTKLQQKCFSPGDPGYQGHMQQIADAERGSSELRDHNECQMQMRKMPQLPHIVKAKIAGAFDFTPYPGDENLVTDQSGYNPEASEIEGAFRGKDWKDISVETILKLKAALPLFTPAAFRYYLPAYMIACVDSYYDVDVALDSVFFNLTPPKSRRGWEWDLFWVRAQQFNKKERDAISSFLELMDQYERVDWASEGMEPPRNRVTLALDFWSNFTEDR